MKKSEIILFVLAAIFAGASVFLFLENRDLAAEKPTDSQLAQELESVRQANRDLRADADTAALELSRSREQRRRLEKECADVGALASDQQEIIRNAEKQISELEKAMKEKDARIGKDKEAALRDETLIAELQKKLAEENRRAEELSGEIVRLRSTQSRTEFETAIADMERKLAETSRERDALDKELARKKAEAETLRERLQDAAAKEQEQTKKIRDLENVIILLRRKAANY
ncbi:MAG TPA: hypothetical protein IAC75_06805 [Candidatus Spyradosoma merdigallinarum]|uniref:Uncharacterized protein n=1 Tax=Candidatus Spyradosoma merdigallinarum TaxID=2840950 RepID=A0A9D1NLJ7_9BACT|nr:hypothetical protein [Candidatus Spyradosoma merdigallinarum]